jgi:hypothetical protein
MRFHREENYVEFSVNSVSSNKVGVTYDSRITILSNYPEPLLAQITQPSSAVDKCYRMAPGYKCSAQ